MSVTRQDRGAPVPWAVIGLLAAGTVAGHALAYRLAHHGVDSLPHRYLSTAAWVAGPLLAMSLGWFLRRGAGGERPRQPVLLLVAQPGIFVLQESVEHLLAGHHLASVAESPTVRWGLALQVLVGVVLLVLTHLAAATGRVMTRGRSTPRLAVGDDGTTGCVDSADATSAVVNRSNSERGPPPLLVPA